MVVGANVKAQDLKVMPSPEAWELPTGIEVRSGVTALGPVVAFVNTETKRATSTNAGAVNPSEPLPAWLTQRINAITT